MTENLATTAEEITANTIYEGFSKDTSRIEFYQAIPKFFCDDQNELRSDGKFPEWLDREFSFDGIKFRAIITPSLINESDDFIFYYPGEVEEQIEEALWMLAYDHRKIYPNDCSHTFRFSANSIRAKLSQNGLYYSIAEISKAIQVLSGTNIKINFESGKFEGSFDRIYPVKLVLFSHQEIITFTIQFNSHFITQLDEGKFRPQM